ncbi:DUF1624 domain-containing protein [Chryseobacterium oryctis]|uniref:DUF1624 domain-containing protein n=1 Tax=Chryseobacterium oryctis TaxID=2952618 RepID=A0ABT3HKK7_9FLAO|nr:DUF1624 domain-containing protein [Chryseobacterium oryctis]MCW3160294.1 DUF1624 domain-containing protein [Chryseobacterium oryctis]
MSTTFTETSRRFIPLDIIKAIGVFMMILMHVFIMYGSESTIYFNNFSQYLLFFIEGIGAPIFVFSMGVSIFLSKDKSIRQVFTRGLKLFVLGYILNFLKFYPTIKVFQVFPEALFTETHRVNDFKGFVEFLLIADILQFAGLAFIIGSVLKKIIEKIPLLGVLLSIIIFVVSPYLYIHDPDYILSLFYGKGFNVYFPLFPWLGFVLLGMSIGYYIRKFVNGKHLKTLFYLLLTSGCLLYLLGLYSIDFNLKKYFSTDYYHKETNVLLMYSGQIMVIFSLMYLVHKYLSEKMIAFSIFSSKNVTTLYVIQWILIYWGWYFVEYQSQSWNGVIVSFLIVSLLTFSITFLKNYLQKLLYERRNCRTVIAGEK